MRCKHLIKRLSNSRLFKDSFWAVFGNGVGNGLLLIAGIIIARLLGKDVYGEYGFVKSTMFYMATFAAMGLGFTTTKFISFHLKESPENVKSILRDSNIITLSFSGTIAIILICFAKPFAILIKAPSLIIAFQALAAIIVFKAITTTQIGLLAGFKEFKIIARNGVLSGLFLLITCVPLIYLWGLKGSLLALFLSQAFNALINYLNIHQISKKLSNQVDRSFKKELIKFSLPVALQESSYIISHWGAIMLLSIYSSMGEVGLYTATSQWNSIILMVPGLLHNVVLSYLSSSINENQTHKRTIVYMLSINFLTTIIPFIIVYILAGFIATFYGPTFSEMPRVLRLLTFATIFECCSQVYKSELMAQSKVWLLFSIRLIRDCILVGLLYILLVNNNGKEGAYLYSICYVISSFILFILLFVGYITFIKKISNKSTVNNTFR